MRDQGAPSYLSSPSRPNLKLPQGTCDTHCHILGPRYRYPYEQITTSVPREAPAEKLFALHEAMGITRCVLVQSVTHGFDNAAVLDAIAQKDGAYRGIAILPTRVSDKKLRDLDAAGFCGVRFNYIIGKLDVTEPIEEVIAFSNRLAEIGWHLQIQLDGPFIFDMIQHLRQSAVPIVIDHMGRVDASLDIDQPNFRHLLTLLESQKFFVKVSGADRISRQGAPYRDAVPFGAKLVAEFGDRVFWGTDWPHAGFSGENIPDDGVLVDLIAQMAPSRALQQALLVDNPERFYRFENLPQGSGSGAKPIICSNLRE